MLSKFTFCAADFWNAHAFIFALDAAAPARFAEAKEELYRMYEGTDAVHPLLVLANKMDLPGAADMATISTALDIDGLARGRSPRTVALKVCKSLSVVEYLMDRDRVYLP
jgi:signal recognition particle receptor subunit beta